MKEIGGYFGLEAFSGREYHDTLIAVNSGRNALAYLLKARNIRKLYIPYFLCNSVSGVCQREGCSVEYYHIGKDFHPIFDKQLSDDEWIYVVNFYGQILNEQAVAMKYRWKNILFDNVQAFFQLPVDGIDTIYSCRKFFGVPDGGYISTNAVLNQPFPVDESRNRMKHILGRFECSASEYYADFKDNDHSFVDLPLRGMSMLTHNLLRAVDYDMVRKIRNENYASLARVLDETNSLDPVTPDGPYCYPYYCRNGMELKKRLAEKKIYVATLWPNVLKCDGTLEKDYAENILPLPCDQRYDVNDMQRIAAALL